MATPATTGALADLKARHLSLMKAWAAAPEEALAEARSVRLAAQALGAHLRDAAERDAAQSIIDYWTSAIARLPGETFPELMRLDPFDEAWPAEVEARARGAYDGLGREAQDEARALLLLLLEEPGRKEVPANLASVLQVLAAAGVVGGSLEAGWAVADESLLREVWPQLGAWLSEERVEDAMVDMLAKSAALWRRYGRRPVNLLSGAALVNSSRYRDQGAEIREFIDASQRRQLLNWFRFAGGLALAGVVVIIAVAVTDGMATQTRNAAVSQVQARAKADVQAAVDELSVAGPVAATPRVTETGLPGRYGYIWIGNAAQPLLTAGGAPGKPTPVSAVRAGGLYVARTSIVLRDSLPDTAVYKSQPRIGVVPAGARVQAQGEPVTYDRPSGAQYWLHVRQLITVYIQFAGDASQAEALRAKLTAAGYHVPDVDREDDGAAGACEVRHVNGDDGDAAERLAKDLAGLMMERRTHRGAAPFGTQAIRDRPDAVTPSGVLEVWVDFDRLSVRPDDYQLPQEPRAGSERARRVC